MLCAHTQPSPRHMHLLWEMEGLQLCAYLSCFLQSSKLQEWTRPHKSRYKTTRWVLAVLGTPTFSRDVPSLLAARWDTARAAMPILTPIFSFLSPCCGKLSCFYYSSFQAMHFFWLCVFVCLLSLFILFVCLFLAPECLQVIPWIPFNPADSPVK